ncbi:MAG: chemotaxis protein CheW [Longimicrobiaceae bacterium]
MAGEPQLGRAAPEKEPDTLVLVVDGQRFGVSLSDAREVLPAPRVTPVPFVPESVRGVCAVRGRVVPVLDLRFRLLGLPAELGERLALVEQAGETVALLVDGVEGMVHAQVTPVPAEVEASLPPGTARGVAGDEGRPITLLELAAVLELADGHTTKTENENDS